jgi:hypothetical protein
MVPVFYVPQMPSVILDAVARTALFCTAFLPLAYVLKISEEMNKMIEKQLLKVKQLLNR